MYGWEAGIRTPIRRSRVPTRAKLINRIKRLARQNADKSGRIRNAAAMKWTSTGRNKPSLKVARDSNPPFSQVIRGAEISAGLA
jgi:hypothetical protein